MPIPVTPEGTRATAIAEPVLAVAVVATGAVVVRVVTAVVNVLNAMLKFVPV